MTEQFLTVLQSHANIRGIVLVAEEVVMREASASRGEIEVALDQLTRAGLVEILAPLPFLVLRLQSWPGRGVEPAVSAGPAYSSQSSLSQSKQLMKESYRQPDEEALLQEILATLGETDPTGFRGALRSYSPGLIRLALDRVRRNPAIRKNRTALFRYLLPRIAKEPPSTT